MQQRRSSSNAVMSQDVNPTMNKFEVDAVPPGDQVARQTAVMNPAFEPGNFSVDQYAEQLMDDLFMGVEHFLETGEELVVEAPAPAPSHIAVETLELPEAAPLSLVAPPAAAAAPNGETVAPEESTTSKASSGENKPDWVLRFLWAATLLSCAGAIAVFLTQWGSYKMLFGQLTGQAPPATTLATADTANGEVGFAAPNQDFANYVKQSLDALEAQQADMLANTTIAAAPAQSLPAVPSAAPTTTIPGGLGTTLPATPGQPTTILERVYIPVYQTPQGLVPVVPGISVPGLNAPALPTAALSGNGVATPNGISLPNLAPGAASTPAGIAASSSAGANTSAAQPLATTQHTLVGLLELGDSSAALFEVNGVTRRFSLGERVGSSGWTLVDVKNSEALVRRNGEVRSVFVGQTF